MNQLQLLVPFCCLCFYQLLGQAARNMVIQEDAILHSEDVSVQLDTPLMIKPVLNASVRSQLKKFNLTTSQHITVSPQGIASFCCSQPHHHHLLCLSESEENVHHHHTFTVSVSISEHKILIWIFTGY